MILNRILREPANIDPTGGVVTVSPAAPKAEMPPASPAPSPAPPKASPNKQKVQVPREPTPDELKGEFSLQPGDAGFVEDFNAEQQPKKEEPKVEPKKEVAAPPAKEEPKDEEPVVEDETPPAPVIDLDKPIVPTGAQPKQRDYTGFTPEEVKVLKNMSTQSFEYVSNVIKQNKELASLKDASYLQHPEAFRLDPQYKAAEENIRYYQQEGEYWQQQLALIKAGKDWTPMRGWDANGRVVLAESRPASGTDEEQIRMMMNQAFGAAQQTNASLQQFGATYNQRIKASNDAIMSELSKRCGWVAEPKLLEEKIQIGDRQETLKDVINNFKGMLPVHYRNGIMTEVAANLWAAMMIYGHQIRLLQNGKQVQGIKEKEVARAEPTSKERPANNGRGKVINGVSEFSMEGVNL